MKDIQFNEVTVFILAMAMLGFSTLHIKALRVIPRYKLLLAGFIVTCVAWGFTVLEDLVWPAVVNQLEHVCYTISAILITVWCMLVFSLRKEKAQ